MKRMSKQEFLAELEAGLSGLPQDDIEERINFYSEMIDDRMEEGNTEKDAVSGIGNVDEVVSQILMDYPLSRIMKERVRPKRRLQAWEIVLLALGSPIWLALLIVLFAVVLAGYIVVWAVIVALWAVEVAVAVCSVGAIAAAVLLVSQGKALIGAAMLGAGVFCAGLSVFMFFGCKAATKGILILTGKMALGIKSLFVGKESAK